MSNPGVLQLAAWWPLDEASGGRADPRGGQTLTDHNTVASAAGLHGLAADFESSNSEYLSHADTAALSLGDVEATLGTWVKLESKGANRTLISKFETTGNQREYRLLYDSGADRFAFTISADGSGTAEASVQAASLGSPATGVWYFVLAWHDPAANLIGIQVNDGTPDTASHSGGIYNGTAVFRLGALGGPAQYHDGLLDEVFLYKRLLAAAERTWLYNGGLGRAYSEAAYPQPEPLRCGLRLPPPSLRITPAGVGLHARPRPLRLTATRGEED